MKGTVILGSTGSIGLKAIDAIAGLGGRFDIVGLSANSNVELLAEQIRKLKPKFACLTDKDKFLELKERIGASKTRIMAGGEGLQFLASAKGAEIVLVAIAGGAALLPTLAAVRAGKKVALANKEALVMAGELIINSARRHSAKIIPVDSEHSAVFQCLNGHSSKDIRRIFLTGSGGPFIDTPKYKLKAIKSRDALRHPKWKMGRKITIDSATLMNKGLEVIEARWLFGVDVKDISVLIHPEAVIHSMVEFVDGSIKAQMGITDMHLPIQYAITYPDIFPDTRHRMDPAKLGSLTFREPDMNRFPCLRLAYEAASKGGSVTAALNAANEVAVESFLKKRIGFTDIPKIIEKILSCHRRLPHPSLKDILDTNRWARDRSYNVIEKISNRRQDCSLR